MKQIEVLYNVKRDGEVIIEREAVVKLTDKNIKEIAEYIRCDQEHQTGELVDIPSHIYDRIQCQIQEDAIRNSKECGGLCNGDVFQMEKLLPPTLLELLPDDVLELLPEEMFGEEGLADDTEEEMEIPAPCKANTLYMTIKQVYFDQIVAGTKTEEYREIKPTTYKKYLEVAEDGAALIDGSLLPESAADMYEPSMALNIYNDGVCPLIPKNELWYLDLAVGYNKVRDTAKVEVLDISFEPEMGNNGKPLLFNLDVRGEVAPSPNGKYCFWIAVLHLGKVVEKNIVSKK